MNFETYDCDRCGGSLTEIDSETYRCQYCGKIFHRQAAQDQAETFRNMFDEMKREHINRLRRNLYDAVNEEYISSKKVSDCAAELKKYISDDFAACFYEIAVGNNAKALTKYIRKLDVEKNYDEIESAIRFLVKSLQTEYQLELNNLIARAYEKRDPARFEELCTKLSEEAVKVDNGVYETKLPREVFIAYSSKDMEKVSELCEFLESQNLKCFVAARNLRHGKGSVENYNKALEDAMDHCRSFVFVSSMNSRSFNCDALTVELPHIQDKDIKNAPPEVRNNYKRIPQQYKKPRVEYRIEESSGFNAADSMSDEFFDGYERVYSCEAVAERVAKQIYSAVDAVSENMEDEPQRKIKYCVGGSEAVLKQKVSILEGEKRQSVVSLASPQMQHRKESEGLVFNLNDEKKSYSVRGRGSWTDEDLVIPQKYMGKPVTSFCVYDFEEYHLKRIKNIFIPATIKEFNFSFLHCTNLENITVDRQNSAYKSIDGVLYSKDGKKLICYPACKSTQKFVIPNGVESVEDWAFTECRQIENVVFSNSITSIGMYAFYNCESLLNVTIGENVTNIGIFAFSGCKGLEGVKIPEGVTSIPEGMFYDNECLDEISIPDGITSIGESAFCNCENLKSLTIPDSVTHIGKAAFWGCSKISELKLGKSIVDIGAQAFWCCKFKELTLDVENIGDCAFEGCRELTSVTINSKNIGDGLFHACSNLKSVAINSKNIGDRLFFGCDNLKNVVIGEQVTSIGVDMFDCCKSLPEVVFENPNGWRRKGGGWFSKISSKILSNPQKATIALKTKYKDCKIERI